MASIRAWQYFWPQREHFYFGELWTNEYFKNELSIQTPRALLNYSSNFNFCVTFCSPFNKHRCFSCCRVAGDGCLSQAMASPTENPDVNGRLACLQTGYVHHHLCDQFTRQRLAAARCITEGLQTLEHSQELHLLDTKTWPLPICCWCSSVFPLTWRGMKLNASRMEILCVVFCGLFKLVPSKRSCVCIWRWWLTAPSALWGTYLVM